MTRLGDYELLARLGEGGMAEVYRAVHVGPHGVNKPCVIKRIATRHALDRRYYDLFLDEARVSVLLTHPNVVQTFELGEAEGRPFLAMELVDGTTVAGLLDGLAVQRQRLPVGAVVEIGLGVARALDYAHRLTGLDGTPLSLTHRDVSPQNILISRHGTVKLTDFGIARHDLRAQETQGPSTKGKVGYMAPEQALGERVDGRTDLFALGVVLAELLGGLRVGTIVLTEMLLPRVKLVLEGSAVRVPALEALVLSLVQPDAARRPSSAAQVVEQLASLHAVTPSQPSLSSLVMQVVGVGEAVDAAKPMDVRGPIEAPSARDPGSPGAAQASAPTTLDLPMSELRRPDSALPPTLSDAPLELAPRVRPAPPRMTRAREEPLPEAPGRGRALIVGAALVVLAAAAYALWPEHRAPTGDVLVTSDPPGAAVWLDDVDTGRVTPTELTGLTLGRAYRVSVQAPEALPEPAHHLVEPVTSGVLLRAPFLMFPSRRVRVETMPPGATVTLNGRRLGGRTPVELPPIRQTQGATLAIEADGSLPLRAEVPTGTVTLMRLVLERARNVVVTSVPDGARVVVDGRDLGLTPTPEVPVPADRPFVLRVSRAGYRPSQRTVDPRRLRPPMIEAQLEELPILALALTPTERTRARELLGERRRLTLQLLEARRRLDVVRLEFTRVSRTRQQLVAPVVDAEAAVTEAEAARDELRDELDRVEGELEILRTEAERRQ